MSSETHLRGGHSTPLRVVMFERRPLQGQRSIERVFEAIRAAAPPEVVIETHRLPFESRGVIPRLRNMRYAWRHRGAVNHITGDVHYVALALPRNGTVLTITDLVGLSGSRRLRRLVLEVVWYRLPVWWACRVVTISEWTRSQLIDLIPQASEKIVSIPCPVPALPKLPPSDLRNERFVLLQVGTAANKNLPRVVEAVRELDLHLRIIGPLREEHRIVLDKYRIDYSNVVGIGDEALATEYLHADAVVFASTYEGFGLPIVEAQSAGRPLITSRVASMPEVAGAGAVLVDPYSVAEIRAAVIEVLAGGSHVEELVAQGSRNVSRFRPDLVARAYADIWEQLASADGGHAR